MIWRAISVFLLLLGLTLLSPLFVDAQQLSDFCVYRDPNDSDAYIGVDESKTPYRFIYGDDGLSEEPYPGATGSVVTSVEKETDEYRAGHALDGMGTCPPSLSLYETNGNVYFHIVSTTCQELMDGSIGNMPDASYDIISTECPWVFDYSTVRMGWCYYDGRQQDNITSSVSFSQAMDNCVNACEARSGLSCSPYSDVRVLWSNLDHDFNITRAEGVSSEETAEKDKELAKEEREEAMNDLVACWEQHHPTEMEDCYASYGEEFDQIKSCVQEQAGGDYQCGAEHEDYRQAEQRLSDTIAMREINLHLTCEQLLGERDSELREFIQYIFNMILFIGLAMLIVFTSLDYAKVVGSGGEDSDMLKKANNKVFKRIGIFALLLFLPVLIMLVLDIFGDPLGIYEHCMEELFRD